MDANELRQKTAEELRRMAEAARAELRDLRFKASLRSLRTVRTLRAKRKELARIMTALATHSK